MANIKDPFRQQVALLAMQEHPRLEGESKRQWYKRVAPFAQCSTSYLQYLADMQECARIGQEHRAKEAKEAAKRCEVMPFDADTLGLFKNFRSWSEQFGRLKLLAELHVNFAIERGDTYAKAFMQDIVDICDRAQNRASIDRRERITPPYKQLTA